ncbi:signal peptidase complex subunit 3 isoform X1 [Falco naumanni]|uniref:signal peptidase complex subunit 3 isoform X1 n=1 Tax=Falco naumanni TaxID=148594 RepID=UPI001ADE295A|nr:signal peptidase complex subunit 3 isoform X1 [Falco naumanni]
MCRHRALLRGPGCEGAPGTPPRPRRGRTGRGGTGSSRKESKAPAAERGAAERAARPSGAFSPVKQPAAEALYRLPWESVTFGTRQPKGTRTFFLRTPPCERCSAGCGPQKARRRQAQPSREAPSRGPPSPADRGGAGGCRGWAGPGPAAGAGAVREACGPALVGRALGEAAPLPTGRARAPSSAALATAPPPAPCRLPAPPGPPEPRPSRRATAAAWEPARRGGRAERGDEHGAVPGQLALRLLFERDGGAHLRLLHHHRLQGAQRARQHRRFPRHAKKCRRFHWT